MLDFFNPILEIFDLSGFACLQFHFCRLWTDERGKAVPGLAAKESSESYPQWMLVEQTLSCFNLEQEIRARTRSWLTSHAAPTCKKNPGLFTHTEHSGLYSKEQLDIVVPEA